MAKFVSLKEVKSQVTFAQVFEHYGLNAQKHGKELVIHCPFHEDKTPSLKANDTKGGFKCFGCGAKGNILTFTARMERIDTGDATKDAREAALRLAEWFGITSNPAREHERSPASTATTHESVTEADQERDKRAREEEKAGNGTQAQNAGTDAVSEREVRTNLPLTFTFQHLDSTHPYLITERGLTAETIATFGLGFHAGKGMMSGRIVIPIHNEAGELVAYAGRWPGDPPEGEPKYKLPPGFRKSLVLFNLHRAREYAREGLIVVEGFFDCFDLSQRGRKNVVGLIGSAMSQAQERLIVETVGPRGRVLLAFDPDDAGRKGMRDAAERLLTQVFVREVVLPVRGS